MPSKRKGSGSGSGIFTDLKKLTAVTDEHTQTLKDHDDRLNGHDDEIVEMDADIVKLANVSMTLSEVCARAQKRRDVRRRLAEIRARREK